MRTLVLIFVAMAAPLQAAWEPADTNGDRCGASCRLRDTNTGFVWTRTLSRDTHTNAQDFCARAGLRLPSLAEYETAIDNGIARANRDFPNFGTPEWFFWTNQNGTYVSLEAPGLNPMTGLPVVKFKCVLAGGGPGGDGVAPPLEEQMDQTGASLGTELQTFESWVNANPGVTVDEPEVNGTFNADGSGKLDIKTPVDFKTQTDLRNQPQKPPANTQPTPAPSWDRVFNDRWGIGGSFIGLELRTSLGATYGGKTNAEFTVAGTLFGQSAQVLQGQAFTTRPTQNTLRAVAVIRALNKTYTLADETLQVGKAASTPRKPLLRETLYRHEQQFMVGPIPVIVTAAITGEIGNDASEWAYNVYSQDGGSGGSVSTNPYSSLVGTFSGGPGVSWAQAGVYGSIAFLDGAAHGFTSGTYETNPQRRSNVCFSVRLKKMNMLNGEAGGYVSWKEPTTQMVERVLGGFCSGGGWLQSKVCAPAKRFMQRVTRLTEFKRTQTWYRFPGRNLGNNHAWYDDCPK